MKNKSYSRLDGALNKIANFKVTKTAKFIDLDPKFLSGDDYETEPSLETKDDIFHGDYEGEFSGNWETQNHAFVEDDDELVDPSYADSYKTNTGKPYDKYQLDEEEMLDGGYIFGEDDDPYIKDINGKHYDILDNTSADTFDQDDEPMKEQEFYELINK